MVRAAAWWLWLLSASAAQASVIDRDWGGYGNNHYNYAICYPPNLKAQGESGSGDGQVFKSADGATLTVFGESLSAGSNLDADMAELVRDNAGQGATVSYRAGKGNWRVASGEGSKGEFYIKRFKRGDQAMSFVLLYPVRLHAFYAPAAAKISKCFTIGSEAGD